MTSLPKDFASTLASLRELLTTVEGCLTEREADFLALLAACPTAQGEVLEIGSFKGKSTIALARGAALAARPNIVAVDPFTSPAITDPSLAGSQSCFDEFQANLRRADVNQYVEVHQQSSYELARCWDRRIRLLWIDGDHTYPATKRDLELFTPFLANGAIVALHDVLTTFAGPIRVFAEDILLCPNFGPAGFCGSIGWAQYLEDPNLVRGYVPRKMRLHHRLLRLLPFVSSPADLRGLAKVRYKFLRWRVPHSAVRPSAWIEQVLCLE